MKKSQFNLLKVANRLSRKYALDANKLKEVIRNDLQQAIVNVSSIPNSGVTPFIQMLRDDGATLAVNVKRDGNKITISPATVNPSSVTSKYTDVPRQIKAYLDKNIEIYPTHYNSDSVDYDDLTVTLNFG